MHVIDTKHDIVTGNVGGMRDAFAALAVPTWADIFDDKGRQLGPRARAILLRSACEKLAGDDGIMPTELCAGLGVPAGTTYGAAVEHLQQAASAREHETRP